MAISIQVCNLAIAEIRGQPIISIDDATIEARECARFYPICLQSLLEVHDWSFATTEATLALLGTNARSGEWLYAYALPADLGTAIRIVWQNALTGGAYSFPLPYYPRFEVWAQPQTLNGLNFLNVGDFIIDEGVLYTNYDAAVLEYSRNDIPDAVMPALFKKALSLDLASYLATAIRDDSRLKGELIQQSEVAKARAMADDLNRQPQRFDEAFSEVAWVRA